MRCGGTRTLRSSRLWRDSEGVSGEKRAVGAPSISMVMSSVVASPSVGTIVEVMISLSTALSGASWTISSSTFSGARCRAVGAGIVAVVLVSV